LVQTGGILAVQKDNFQAAQGDQSGWIFRNDWCESAILNEVRIIQDLLAAQGGGDSIQAYPGKRSEGDAGHCCTGTPARAWRYALGKVFCFCRTANANPVLFLGKTQRKLKDDKAQDGIQKQRQDRDHEQRAPVAKLIAKLANPDQAND